MKRLALFCLLVLASTSLDAAPRKKTLLGALEFVQLPEAKLEYVARIDTGAATSSVHAEDIELEPKGRDGHRMLHFVTRLKKGGAPRKLRAELVDSVTVRGSEGADRRYVVELVLSCRGRKKRSRVNLNDRSRMRYQLLIGRSFLEGAFIVDVSRNKKAARRP